MDKLAGMIESPNVHVPICGICGGIGFKPFKLSLMQCVKCGVVLSPAIWRPLANEHMEEEWFGENYQLNTSFWVDVFESWNNRRTLERLARTQSSGRRLLEVGVGSGSFLAAALAAGYEVMGCDLSEPICRRVQMRHHIAMHCGSLTSLKAEGCFDIIVLNHVVEHIQQPIAFLREVYSRLSPGGVAHIAVPNVNCWEAKLSGWNSFEPYHLIYFAPHTLERAVTASGLVIDRLTTHDSFSGWFLAVLRTTLGVNRSSGAVIRTSFAAPQSLMNRRSPWVEHTYRVAMMSVGGALWPLRWVQARFLRGDEIICIARHPRSSVLRQG